MGAPNEQNLSVQLTLTPQLVADLGREAGALEVAQAYVIDSPEMAQLANKELQDVKRRLKAVEDWRERFLAPVRQLTDTANEFFNPARAALKASEECLKTALLGWNRKEEERVAAERRAAEEAARRARAEAEARAAAERAKAEEQAREARQKAAAAEAERLRAAQEAERLRREGDAKAAAEQERLARAAAAERAKQEENERAKIEAGEARAQQVTMAAAAVQTPEVHATAKLAGFTPRDNWVTEDEPGRSEEELTLLLVMAAAGVGFDEQGKRVLIAPRGELLALVKRDKSAANKLAKALKKAFNVPGMRAVNNPVAASRSA